MQQLKPEQIVFCVALALFAVAVGVYLNAAAFSDADFLVLSDFFTVALSGLAFAALVFVCLATKKTDDRRTGWALLAAGFGSWFAAEVVWAFYELVLGIETSVFSLADAFWWLGYFPMAAGMYFLSKTFFIHLSEAKKIVLAAATAAAVVAAMVLLGGVAAEASVPWQVVVSQAFYPLADLVLLALAAYIALGTLEFTKFSRVFFVLAAAFVVWVVFDYWFAYAVFVGVYDPKQFYDVVYLLTYLLVAAAAACRSCSLKNFFAKKVMVFLG